MISINIFLFCYMVWIKTGSGLEIDWKWIGSRLEETVSRLEVNWKKLEGDWYKSG